jgi:hypothetical protein
MTKLLLSDILFLIAVTLGAAFLSWTLAYIIWWLLT